jgi:hypothetical protein
MAGYPALGGQRIRILLSAVVGQLNNDKEHNLGNRVKGLLGGNKDGDK